MGKDCVEACTKGFEQIQGPIRINFKRKLEDAARDDLMRQRVAESLIDQVERVAKEVKDHCQDKLESALRSKAASLAISKNF